MLWHGGFFIFYLFFTIADFNFNNAELFYCHRREAFLGDAIVIIYLKAVAVVLRSKKMKEKIEAFTLKHKELWKFIKFTFTGASTSVLELAVFMFLQYVTFKSLNEVPVTDSPFLAFLGIEYKGYLYSYAISATIGYAAAYVMNRKLTFQADNNPVFSTVVYVIMVVGTILFNTWFGAYLGTIIKNNGWDNAVVEMIVKVIVMTVPTLWTYPLNRFVIHRKREIETV